MKHNLKLLILFFSISTRLNLIASELVFYKAPAFFGEPRLTKEYLGSLEWTAGGGHAREGFNGIDQKTNILNIYGPQNFRNLAQNVPAQILNQNPGAVINNLWENSLPGFGLIEFDGKFKLTEWVLDYQQNFKHGLFMWLHLPVLRASVKDFKYTDLSSPTLTDPTTYANWQIFVANLVSNMQLYGINLENYQKASLGDLRLSLGWSQTKVEGNHYVDFWDTAIQVGLIIPAAPFVSYLCPLVVPLGYNKNIAFPLSFDVSFGIYEWLTAGVHIEGILFTSKYQNIGMQTAIAQKGIINLTSGLAKVEMGNIWQFGTFIKSDHMPWGMSILLAYSYSAEQRTCLNPQNTAIFDRTIVNADQTLFGWHMHTINTSIEYDFAIEPEKQNFPRLRMNFDIPIAGKNIYKTMIFSGTIGCDFVW